MKEIPADKFKTQCLAVIRQVQKTEEPVLITKGGKAIVKLVPVGDEIFGYMSGKLKVVGDISRMTPSGEDWENK